MALPRFFLRERLAEDSQRSGGDGAAAAGLYDPGDDIYIELVAHHWQRHVDDAAVDGRHGIAQHERDQYKSRVL